MKRHVFVSLAVVSLVLFVMVGCLAPRNDTLGAIELRESSSQIELYAKQSFSAVELTVDKPLKSTEVIVPNGFLKIVNGKRVAIAKVGGDVEIGELIAKLPKGCRVIDAKFSLTDFRAAPSIKLSIYEKNDKYKLYGDAKVGKHTYDSKVDPYDFLAFVKAFSGDEENPRLDITGRAVKVVDEKGRFLFWAIDTSKKGDGKVDYDDFGFFAQNYGKAKNRLPKPVLYADGEKKDDKDYVGDGAILTFKIVDPDDNETEGYFQVGNKKSQELTVDFGDKNSFNFKLYYKDSVMSEYASKDYILYKSGIWIEFEEESGNIGEKPNILTGSGDYYLATGKIGGDYNRNETFKFVFRLYEDGKQVGGKAEVNESVIDEINLKIDYSQVKLQVYKSKELVSEKIWDIEDMKPAEKHTFYLEVEAEDSNGSTLAEGKSKTVAIYYFADSVTVKFYIEEPATVVNGKIWSKGKIPVKITLESTGISLNEKKGIMITVKNEYKADKYNNSYNKDWWYDYFNPINYIEDALDKVDNISYLATPATITLDLEPIFKRVVAFYNGKCVGVKSTIRTRFIGVESSDPHDDPAFENTDGLNTIYYDKCHPILNDVLEIENKPNSNVKVFFKRDETEEPFVDLAGYDATLNMYIGDTVVASKAFGKGEGDITLEAEIDFNSLKKKYDKTQFKLGVYVEDEFGNGYEYKFYDKDTNGKGLYIDNLLEPKATETVSYAPDGESESNNERYFSSKAEFILDFSNERSGVDEKKATITNYDEIDDTVEASAAWKGQILTFILEPNEKWEQEEVGGKLVDVEVKAVDKEGNEYTDHATFVVDTVAATFTKIEIEGGKVVNTDEKGYNDRGDETVAKPLVVHLGTTSDEDQEEHIYKVIAVAHIGKNSKEFTVLTATDVSQFELDLQKYGVVVSGEPATIVMTLEDLSGNTRSATITWTKLNSAKRALFVGWEEKGYDILRYKPEPFKPAGKETTSISVKLDQIKLIGGKVGFVIHAYSPDNSTIAVKSKDGSLATAGEKSKNELFTAELTGDSTNATIAVLLESAEEKDFEKSDIEFVVYKGDENDELKTTAKVTFDVAELEPISGDYQATITIDRASQKATLEIGLVNPKKYDLIENIDASTPIGIWTMDGEAVEAIEDPDKIDNSATSTVKVDLTISKYDLSQEYYMIYVGEGAMKTFLKGGSNLYLDNDKKLELKAKVVVK